LFSSDRPEGITARAMPSQCNKQRWMQVKQIAELVNIRFFIFIF